MNMLVAGLVLVCLSQSGALPTVKHRLDITREEALARANRVLDNYPLVDGHNDLPHQYRRRVDNDVTAVDLSTDVNSQWGFSHTDIPRLREGKVGAQFWAAFASCSKQGRDAVRAGLEQVDNIKRMVEAYPDDFQFVTTADGIEEAFAAGKIGSLIGLESGHMIDNSAGTLRMYYDLGVRYMTLTHSCSTGWADNSYEDDDDDNNPRRGLTAWGLDLVREMNRLGMLVDISHVAKLTMLEALRVSEAPVIFSHSSVHAICGHNRNVQDDVLQKMAQHNGLIMITFVGSFLDCGTTVADIELVADHVEYVRDLVGVDYVGIGGDYDGTSRLPVGMEDVSTYPALFAELIMRGWSDEDLEKLAGRNLVRVFREVEAVKADVRNETPMYDWIPQEDLPESDCRTLN